MKTSGLPLSVTPLLAAAAITLACGSSSKPVNNSGSIQSVTVSPAIADVQDFPGDQVQFVATGYYKTPPSPITPLAAMWGGLPEQCTNH
jgi:hypothetical protein